MKHQEAKKTFRRLADIREGLLGNVHMLVADALNRLGCALLILGDYAEAQAMHQRALAIFELHIE